MFLLALLLSIPWLQKTSVSLLDNLFIATSAVSTTGLVTISIFDSYTGRGQFVVMILFQLGGIGYLTFTTFMILSNTSKITHRHQSLLKTEFTLFITIKIKDFLKSVVIFTLVMEVLGALLFFIAFNKQGMAFGEALWFSIFHSISAFCTAGYSLFNSKLTEYSDSVLVNTIISILAIAGSLCFIVVTEFVMFFRKKARKFSFTTKIVFYGFLILPLLGFVFLYAFEPEISSLTGRERVLTAFFQSMSAMTTVGFNTVDCGDFLLPMLLVTIF